MENIKKLFEEFCDLPYPSEAHIGGADFEMYDTFAAGCIQTFIRNGKLSKRYKDILKRCKDGIEKDFNLLPEKGKEYFEKLLILINLVLQRA